MLPKPILFLLAIGFLAASAVPAQTADLPSEPLNLDLEQDAIGDKPPGWFVPSATRDAGYTVELTEAGPRSGERCAIIRREGPPPAGSFGNLMQSFDASAYRGKRVRFRAAVRTEVPGRGSRAQLWLRVDLPEERMGFFDNMGDRPITSSEWTYYEIVGLVAEDAETINIGAFLAGHGKLFIDDVSFEALGHVRIASEPARPLEGRGLDNLVAFARLLGYVRYFYPGDEAAEVDWESFAIQGVRRVESAAGPAELARILQELFEPIAPAVRVFPRGAQGEPLVLEPPEGEEKSVIIAWRHLGVGTGSTGSIYSSTRVSNAAREREGFGNLMQMIDAAPYRGKKVRFRAAVRAEVETIDDRVQLWLRVDRPERQTGFFDNMDDRPITSTEWKHHEIVGRVADDAVGIAMGAMLIGEGRGWVDDFSFEVVDGESPGEGLRNPKLEQGLPGDTPVGWYVPPGSEQTGYRVESTREGAFEGDSSALLAAEELTPYAIPDPGQLFRTSLGGGIELAMPIALYRDESGTLPRATGLPPVEDTEEPSGNDRGTRLAAVTLGWNVFQHFYPYFDVVETDWNAVLPRSLSAAATDPDEDAFLLTLRRMVAVLHDGHGGVSLGSPRASHRVPLLWGWVEDRLVALYVAESVAEQVRPGDVVLEIDGTPAETAVAEAMELVSGATTGWKHWRALNELASGPEGEEVALELRRGDDDPFVVTLRREVPMWGEGALEETRPAKVEEIRPGIFYLDLQRMSDDDLEQVLPDLAQARGIICDMRGYPRLSVKLLGHLTDEPITCARWNVPIVTRPDRQEMDYQFSNWPVEPQEPRLLAKVAFLTDGRAISYAETYMGIVEHYKLAEIVGSPTAGTNGNVNPLQLPGGYRVTWTGMKVLKHDGSQHHGIGILPTLPVKRTLAGVTAGRDEVLERAIEIVSR